MKTVAEIVVLRLSGNDQLALIVDRDPCGGCQHNRQKMFAKKFTRRHEKAMGIVPGPAQTAGRVEVIRRSAPLDRRPVDSSSTATQRGNPLEGTPESAKLFLDHFLGKSSKKLPSIGQYCGCYRPIDGGSS